MGGMKEWMLEQEERGWWSLGDYDVCAGCVSHPALVAWVEQHAAALRCDFCGSGGDGEPISADADGLARVVFDGFRVDWGDANQEGVPFESAEGGWQADVTDTYDLLVDYEVAAHDALFDALLRSMLDRGWVQRDFWRLPESERLALNWAAFREAAIDADDDEIGKPGDAELMDDPDALSPEQTLRAVGEAVERASIVDELPADTPIWRVRVHGADQTPSTARDLGAAPAHRVVSPNRMSRVGEVMFYGARDRETAIEEALRACSTRPEALTVGRFRTRHPIRLVDLEAIPDPPSVFEPDRRDRIHPLRFLRGFGHDVSRPVTRDGQEHREYRPTQLVTDQLRRTLVTGANGPWVLGLAFGSARRPGGINVALWIDETGTCDPADEHAAGPDVHLVLEDSEPLSCPAG